MILFFWYCFDDWLAHATETPWLGQVPPLVVVVASVLVCIHSRRYLSVTLKQPQEKAD